MLDFECLKWGILILMSCKLFIFLWIEICLNSKKCCVELVVFVIKMYKMLKWIWFLVSSGRMWKMKYVVVYLLIVLKLLVLWEVVSLMMVYIFEILLVLF